MLARPVCTTHVGFAPPALSGNGRSEVQYKYLRPRRFSRSDTNNSLHTHPTALCVQDST
jgi:hypothetical protein